MVYLLFFPFIFVVADGWSRSRPESASVTLVSELGLSVKEPFLSPTRLYYNLARSWFPEESTF